MSDFFKGLNGSAISVGLLYQQIPVLGVVYAPVTNIMPERLIGDTDYGTASM